MKGDLTLAHSSSMLKSILASYKEEMLQAYLQDTEGSVPDHGNKRILQLSESHNFWGFPVNIKGMRTLYCKCINCAIALSLLSNVHNLSKRFFVAKKC